MKYSYTVFIIKIAFLLGRKIVVLIIFIGKETKSNKLYKT